MRALAVIAVLAVAPPAAAEQMPPGTIGPVFGAIGGTGADATNFGFGVNYFGLQAAFQPMKTETPYGFAVRWAALFGFVYGGEAAQIDSPLRTVQMDLTVGVRFRPWRSPNRYLTLRFGGELLRANEPIPPEMSRSFLGGIASVGLDWYAWGVMFNFDVRYGLIGQGPRTLALLVGVGFTGP